MNELHERQGWDQQTTHDMNTYLVQSHLYADFPKSFAQVVQLGVGTHGVQSL